MVIIHQNKLEESTLGVTICPSFWYQMALFRVLAHELYGALSLPKNSMGWSWPKFNSYVQVSTYPAKVWRRFSVETIEFGLKVVMQETWCFFHDIRLAKGLHDSMPTDFDRHVFIKV